MSDGSYAVAACAGDEGVAREVRVWFEVERPAVVSGNEALAGVDLAAPSMTPH